MTRETATERDEGSLEEEKYDLIQDYLEKLIQIPYHLPRLLPPEIESYLLTNSRIGKPRNIIVLAIAKFSALYTRKVSLIVQQSLAEPGAELNGETRKIAVAVSPPLNTTAGTTDTFTFTVANASTPDITNQTTIGPVTVQDPPALNLGAVTTVAAGGNGDAVIDPGEGGALTVQLINPGTSQATNISATLTAKTPGITISAGESVYSNIAPGIRLFIWWENYFL